MENPLVSIITPCYNSENYISRFMECLLSQTYKNIEWIAVNDGSTDSTEELINSYRKRLEGSGIKVIYKYQANKGLGGAINTGLKLVTGDFFTWCDSDNLITDDCIEEEVKMFISNPEIMIVRCDGYDVLDSDISNPISKMSETVTDKFRKKLFYNCLTNRDFYFGLTVLRTEAFDRVNPERNIYPSREGQNWQLLLPMFYSYDAYYIDKPMFYFVIRNNSISNIARNSGVEQILVQNNEYEKIEMETIKSMNFPEKENCIQMILYHYAVVRFWLYDELDNDVKINEEYKIIKKYSKETPEIDKVYRRRKNPIWKLLHYIKKQVKQK